MYSTRVLVLLALLVEFVHCFSWDIAVGRERQLKFYYNGTLTHTEVITAANWITSVTYDPVHYRVLFSDHNWSKASISSFDLSTRKRQSLFTREKDMYVRLVYDPVTQALYWKEYSRIYSFSLNSASSNQADGNLLVTLDDYHVCRNLAVDSCGGYIYWITDYEIERAQLDGSEREVLIDGRVYLRLGFAIDQQTQKLYWAERTHSSDEQWTIESANFNGKNRTTLYIERNTDYVFSLAVSKDFIYWQKYNEQGIWQLPKYSSKTVARKIHSMSSETCASCHLIATNYTIKEQIQGIKSCKSLQSLIPNDSESESTVSVCQNYCFKGECSVSAEGQPTCSCMTGYSGKRCEVSICKDYCFQGNCSVGAKGQPKCSCMTGYFGERCEENSCYKHCLNGGVCSLNEEDEPACQCTAGYDGERCEVSANKDNSCDNSGAGNSGTGNSGEGTVSACHQFCLNDGTCSLNEATEPVCQCKADYAGERCDVPAFIAKWVLHAYKNVPLVTLSDAVKSA